MKILLATHFFPPTQAGGTEVYTLGLATSLIRLGHAVEVVCAENWGMGDSWRPVERKTEFDGVPVRRLSWNWERAPDPFRYLYHNPAVEQHFSGLLRELQPDVLHITSCYSLGAGIIRAARRAGVPIVLTLTDFWFISPRQTLLRPDGSLCYGPESRLQCAECLGESSRLVQRLKNVVPSRLLQYGLVAASEVPVVGRARGLRGNVGNVQARSHVLRRIFDEVDQPIAPSRFLRDLFVRNGYPIERFRVSPYGLDAAWLADLPQRASDEPITFGFIGQLEPTKGPDVLVRAFRQLGDARRCELKLWGSSSKNPAFSQHLQQLSAGDERIRFMGAFDRTTIAQVYSQVDVVVVPSVWFENTPIVVTEAFAARKPVIATNLGGISEAVQHGGNGLLFELGDIAALTSLLQRVLLEPDLLAQLESGIPPVRTIENEIASLLDLYAGLALSATLSQPRPNSVWKAAPRCLAGT